MVEETANAEDFVADTEHEEQVQQVSAVPELPAAPEEPVVPMPISPVRALNGDEFFDWMLTKAIPFLDLADLERVKTAESLRGTKEPAIRDKIQMANSMLVLLANYGSDADNENLVKWCEAYAEKMKTIIKRLCL